MISNTLTWTIGELNANEALPASYPGFKKYALKEVVDALASQPDYKGTTHTGNQTYYTGPGVVKITNNTGTTIEIGVINTDEESAAYDAATTYAGLQSAIGFFPMDDLETLLFSQGELGRPFFIVAKKASGAADATASLSIGLMQYGPVKFVPIH